MKLAYSQIKKIWFDETHEFYLASLDQVNRLCDELGTDRPLMRWHNLQEELQSLYAEAVREMEMGY